VNQALLREINSIGDIVLATRKSYTACQEGTIIAGTKINPRYISEDKLKKLEELCQKQGKVIEVIPLKVKSVGIVITGNEVFKGRIKDKFGETIRKKVEALGSVINHQTILPDDEDLIAQAIIEMKDRGSVFLASEKGPTFGSPNGDHSG